MNTEPTSTVRIRWYRSPVPKDVLAELNTRSDLRGWLQTGGCLALLCFTGGLVLYAAGHWPWWGVGLCLFLHGTLFNPMSSAVHELIHRTVFKTKWLNDFFARLFSFITWANNATFHPSHMRHHQHTLHQPDDLEVVLPIKVLKKHFLLYGFVNLPAVRRSLIAALRYARGHFEGEWELKNFPEDEAEKRRPPILWARVQLGGHAAILLSCIVAGAMLSPVWRFVPLLTTFGPFYGTWLAMLLGIPQHIGLQDKVADYRLCCRTYTAHPFLQFLYWNMNYHTEHHMYAAVPCYNLGKLHRAIQDDLPECPHGLIATWQQIFAIMRKQEANPDYQYVAPLPNTAGHNLQRA